MSKRRVPVRRTGILQPVQETSDDHHAPPALTATSAPVTPGPPYAGSWAGSVDGVAAGAIVLLAGGHIVAALVIVPVVVRALASPRG